MSNNKAFSRKAVACVGAVSLGLTGISALPSFAGEQTYGTGVPAGNVTLAPRTGTEWNILHNTAYDDGFKLKANITNIAESDRDSIKFLVEPGNDSTDLTASNDVFFDWDQDDYDASSEFSSRYSSMGTSWSFDASADTITFTSAGHNFVVGDNVWTLSDNPGGDANEIDDIDYEWLDVVGVSGDLVILDADGYIDNNGLDPEIDASGLDDVLLVLDGDDQYIETTNADDVAVLIWDTREDTNDNTVYVHIESSVENPDESQSVKVTAWVDADGDNVIDANEYASPTETVNFLLADDVTATAAFDPLILGSTTITGTVTTNPVLNVNQSETGDLQAQLTYQGNSGDFVRNASPNTTTRQWTFTSERSYTITDVAVSGTTTTLTFDGAHDILAGETLVLSSLNDSDNGSQVVYPVSGQATKVSYTDSTNSGADDSGTAKIAVVSGAYSVKAKIDDTVYGAGSGSVAPAVANDGSTATASGANTKVVVDANGDASVSVRKTTKAVSATFSFLDEGKAKLAAGRPVVVTLATDATGVKLNGTTKTDGQTLNAVTDANGQVKIDVTTTSGAVGDTVTLTAVAEGQSVSSTYVTFEWVQTVYVLHDLNSNSSSTNRNVAAGGSYTFNFAMLDNWAQTPTAGSYRLKVALTGNTISTTTVAMTNGRASVTVADGKLGSDNVTVTVDPQKANAAGTVWQEDIDVDTDDVAAQQVFTLNPTGQSAAVSATVAGSPATLNTATLVAGDERTSQLDVTEPADITLSGVVTDSLTGVVKPGAAVTISGPSSLLFISSLGNNLEYAAFGSIKVFAGSDGAYSVRITSNRAQTDSVVTVSAMGATKTAKVSISAAAETAGSEITSSAPKSVLGGRTLAVTLSLKDKFGNAVNGGDTDSGVSEIALSYDGPGFVTTDLGSVTELGTDGAYTVRVLLSSGDTGIGTFTLSYDPSGDDLTSTDVVSKSVAVWVGPIANAKAGAKKGRVIVEAYRAKGKTVNVFVGSTRVASFVADKANDSMVVRGIKSGTRNVRVVLSGPGEDFRGAITVK